MSAAFWRHSVICPFIEIPSFVNSAANYKTTRLLFHTFTVIFDLSIVTDTSPLTRSKFASNVLK